jgi:hypothetical protein
VASRTPVTARLPAETPPPVETAVRIARRKMAIRSSTIRTPSTTSVNGPDTRCSSNALTMIVVLEMATMAPVNTLSIVVQPRSCPSRKPAHTIALVSARAMMPAVGTTRTSLRRLNSSPSENMRRMTPSSDSAATISRSAVSGIGVYGPTIIPASR